MVTDTGNQFTVFALCIAVGLCLGILYEPFGVLRTAFGCRRGKNKAVATALDMLFCVCCAIVCVGTAYSFKFPSFRVYMWTGYLLGGIIYLKTLHKIIAFFEIMWYNSIKKLINKARNQEKTLIKEEKKR